MAASTLIRRRSGSESKRRQPVSTKTQCTGGAARWRRTARVLTLFVFGSAYSFVLNVAQATGESARFRPGEAWLGTLLRATWWLPPLCGCVTAVLGLLIPELDRRLALFHPLPEPAHTARVLLTMLGFHHASTRVPLTDATGVARLTLTVSLCSAFWLVFDRSPAGLGIATASYAVAHLLARIIEQRGLYDLEHVDAANVVCWLPTLFFAAAIMLATIGRQLEHTFSLSPQNDVSEQRQVKKLKAE